MAVVKLTKKIFEKEVGKLDEKMQEQIALFGTPIDKITDDTIEIEVFPNRPDILSYHGFKRAFLTFLGKKKGLKEYTVKEPEKNYYVTIDPSVKDVRPYTVCAVVKNIAFDEEKIKELIDVQEKLHQTLGRKRKKLAIGIYPLEEITFPIQFTAKEGDKIRFIPLDETREMSGLEILQKHPKGKEFAPLLRGKAKFPVFIDAKNEILSMPPIINAEKTGKVTTKTNAIFIECSGFDLPVMKKCLNILVTMCIEMNGVAYQVEVRDKVKEKTPNLNYETKKISLEHANKLLGLMLSEKEMQELLSRMGHSHEKGIVKIGCWRTDILHEVDVIEDIAIAYGYNNFTPEIPKVATIGEKNQFEAQKRVLAKMLANVGFIEVSNYHLTIPEDQFEKMGRDAKKERGISVENSKTEYTLLRENLTQYLLKNLSENVDVEYPQKIFELGKVFEEEKESIEEKEMFSGAITPGNFTDAKQVLEYVAKMLGMSFSYEEALDVPPHAIPGRTAKIMHNAKPIGYLTEIHPKILKNWKIKMPVSIFEINTKALLAL